MSEQKVSQAAINYATQNLKDTARGLGLDDAIDTLTLYIVYGIEPGSFVYSVLCNDLKAAAGNADDINRHKLYQWAKLVYNGVPAHAQGSPEKVRTWMAAGGLEGGA